MAKTIRCGLVGFLLGMAWIGIAATCARAQIAIVVPGNYEMVEVDGPSRRTICLADLEALLRMDAPGCARTGLAQSSAVIVAHYNCARTGWRRNAITLHGSHSVTLDTQGIMRGEPFAATYRGHRVGACTPPR